MSKPCPRSIEELLAELPNLIAEVQELIDYLDGDPDEIHDDGYCDREELAATAVITWLYGPQVWNWIDSKR